MRPRPVLAFVALAAACGETPVEIVEPEPTFDLDAVVDHRGVQVWLRDVSTWSCVPDQRFPHPDECFEWSDALVCRGEPPACLERIALLREGIELASIDTFVGPATYLNPPGLFALGEVQLRITGCGASHEITLSPPLLAAPTITDLTTDGDWVSGTSAAPGATGVWADIANGFVGATCQVAGATDWRVGPLDHVYGRVELYLASIVGAEPITTPWGSAHVWQRQILPSATEILIPRRANANGWRFTVADNERSTHTIGGGPAIPLGAIAEWGIEETASGSRIDVWWWDNTRYVAGETTDRIWIELIDGRYTATFPHVTPSNDVDLGLTADTALALTIGPITLTHDTNPSLTHTATFDLSWEHPPIPRLAP